MFYDFFMGICWDARGISYGCVGFYGDCKLKRKTENEKKCEDLSTP